jgi:putative two-component system response regulator
VNILIVDDDDFALHVVEQTIARMGHSAVTAHDGLQALEILRKGEIRLMITDWDMPGMNGIELCRTIRREDFTGYIYIIMLTACEGARQRLEGLYAGADDFLVKPLDPEELLVCLKTAERILSLETRDLALFAMAKLAESRNRETGAHIERIQTYARLIGQNLSAETKTEYGVDDNYIHLLYQTSPLHDLGKVGIPDAILLKSGELTLEERAFMQKHATIGAETLDAALKRYPNAVFLRMARDIAATHHERFDGAGYPRGLVGKEIPLCGRIVALADTYDVLTSRRVYKDASHHDQARKEILAERGGQFDPDVVDAFLRAETEIVAAGERLRDEAQIPATRFDVLPPPRPLTYGPHACTILIVEDDPALLARLSELLAGTGEPVVTAKDEEDAMAAVETLRPRVVVADWVLPKGDGVDLCRRIRANPATSMAHFLMLTVHSDKCRLLEAYEAGVDDFVAKPFDAEELLARVRAGLRAARLQDDLVRRALGSRAMTGKLAAANTKLERLSITDELTGLFNRRHAMISLDELWEAAQRDSAPLAVAMIDIDHFKNINDELGHDAGDLLLRQLASLLRDKTRATDMACRLGGEEFLIIFPSQTIQEASIVAERIRAAVQDRHFAARGASIRATISIGLAARAPRVAQFTNLLKLADQALYAAKNAGRNLVRTMDDIPEELPMNTPDSAPVDFSAVLKRCGGDSKFATAVADRFRAHAGPEIERLTSALAAGDADTVRRAAHTLKSMAAYMGADAVSELAKDIEHIAAEKRLAEIPPLAVRLQEQTTRALEWIAQNEKDLLARCA